MRGTNYAHLAVGLVALSTGNIVIEPLTNAFTLRSVHNTSSSLVAIPFGTLGDVKFSEPPVVQTAKSELDTNKIASDESWAKSKTKGRFYGCLLNMSNENAGLETKKRTNTLPSVESVWRGDLQSMSKLCRDGRILLTNNPDELHNWGWHQAAYPPEINCDFRDELALGTENRIGTALTTLGLSLLPATAGGDNECFSVEHFDETLVDENGEEVPLKDQSYSIDDRTYPCTGAYYRFAMNKRGGAIFVQSLQKPESAAKENLGGDVPKDKLPQLNRASDVMWGYWVRSNSRPQNLYNYFVNHVRNDETLPLIARALKNHGMNQVPYWPGLELSMHTEDAEAILGKFYVMLHYLLALPNRHLRLSHRIHNRAFSIATQASPWY